MSTQLKPSQYPRSPAASDSGSWYAASLPRSAPWVLLAAVALLAAAANRFLGLSLGVAVVAGWLLYVLVLTVASRIVEGVRKSTDRLATALVTSAFLIAVMPLTTLFWQVVSKGAPAINSTFLTFSMRNVVGEGGGIYHALVGTLLVTGLAALISIPVGVLSAIYLVEYGQGRLASSITFLIDVMTGIPSIVAGLFAYALFVIFFGEGVRMGFAGAVALSLLMIPLVVRSSEEMLKLVPNELREASYALGVPKWRTIVKVVLPTALAGIVTGITIAVARIIGETAPLLIICGATDSTNFNPFHGRIMTLPVYIFSQYAHPGIPPEFSVERAWGAALVLTVIVMVLNLGARLVSYFYSPKTKA
jgi:phosphate transport system permease protein